MQNPIAPLSRASVQMRSLNIGPGQAEWRRLESGVCYGKLANQHGMIGTLVPVLITMFHSTVDVSTIPANKKNGIDVKACT